MAYDNIVRVYDKNLNMIAIFEKPDASLDEQAMRNQMVAPTVHRETNGDSTLSFQMLSNCEKWQDIKDPENIYELNDHYYTALNDGAYQYVGEGPTSIVNVTLVETWYLLDKKYVQAYNCGIYCYAKAKFTGYTTDGANFTIQATDCSNPSNTISNALAWNQVKLWTPRDDNGNDLSYGILKSDEYKPSGWEDAPSGVFFSSFNVSDSSVNVTIRARAKTHVQKNFEYTGTSYKLDTLPYPASLESVYVNSTVETQEKGDSGQTYTRYTTSNKQASYNYSNGNITLKYVKASNETINSVIVSYEYYDLGEISSGATCTFSYGAEAVDEHTFIILPKSNSKYKLTVNGVEYNESEVKDARGVVMPRGSGGYALWAALKGSGWDIGICDVIAKGFDTSIDYGCFNLESDMKDVLYIVQYIQELYGGILDFDSKNKVVNYRAENADDYDSYEDHFNAWKGYEFREEKNMTDQPEVTYDNELITKAYLLGYGNLNVKKVNDGKTYIEDFSYTNNVYDGYLEQSLIYDTRDDGGMRQLMYWGARELAKQCKPRKKITIHATDIRTIDGYEHEVFDLNDIVRCYYKDTETGEEICAEKRITLWEYNAFAMRECTVEIGDKTQNLTDMFKLVYNTAIKEAPKTNASGEISSDEIIVNIPDFEMNLSDYLNSISNQYNESADAISELYTITNDLYSQTELAVSYHKVTENMVSDTYAGLVLYADDQVSALSLTVEGHYNELVRADETISRDLNGKIVQVQKDTAAGFEAQQTKNEAFATQFAEMNTRITTLDGELIQTKESLAFVETRVTEDEATVTLLAKHVEENYDEVTGKLSDQSLSIASIKLQADADRAKIELNAEHIQENYNTITGRLVEHTQTMANIIIDATNDRAEFRANAELEKQHYNELSGELEKEVNARASFEATVTKDYAKTEQLSTYATKNYVTGQISSSSASIQTWASENFASIDLKTTVDGHTTKMAHVSVTTSNITLNSNVAGSGAYLSLNSTGSSTFSASSISLQSSSVYVGTSASTTNVRLYGTVYIGGNAVSWKTATISGTTINYLGQ